MSKVSDWSISGSQGQPILGNTHMSAPGSTPGSTAGSTPIGVMLICHGFKGYKDYGFFPQLAEPPRRPA